MLYNIVQSDKITHFDIEKDEIERVDKLEVDDTSKFDVTVVYSFELPPERQDEAIYETMDDNDGSDTALFELDDRLIDYDMLTAEPEDADRIYQELKERAMRQRRKDIKDKEIEDAIEIDESEEDASNETQAESDLQSANKLF